MKERNTSRTKEERALLALGRAAEEFIVLDRRAREIRQRRNDLLISACRNHPPEEDDTLFCFEVGVREGVR